MVVVVGSVVVVVGAMVVVVVGSVVVVVVGSVVVGALVVVVVGDSVVVVAGGSVVVGTPPTSSERSSVGPQAEITIRAATRRHAWPVPRPRFRSDHPP
ncbi:MAG TPA: hypothetical protein VHE80_07235, partial [Acidimicrobiales bacterium]|nr:hypothetical protein [Acidimicrobiales bacterium]